MPNLTEGANLLSISDTNHMQDIVSVYTGYNDSTSPTKYPIIGELMPIADIFERLISLVGIRFPYLGALQERNRGGILHRLVCEALGYSSYSDDGKFPDVKHQLLEVKLQTSPTIDLGLILPSSEEPLDIPQINGQNIRMCDVRYAVFYGDIDDDEVVITRCYLVTGKDFFQHFQKFGGMKVNKKLQIPLPIDFI